MNLFEFIQNNPGAVLVAIIVIAVAVNLALATIVRVPIIIVNRWLRSRNIAKQGWPPPHCDGDGDLVQEADEYRWDDFNAWMEQLDERLGGVRLGPVELAKLSFEAARERE